MSYVRREIDKVCDDPSTPPADTTALDTVSLLARISDQLAQLDQRMWVPGIPLTIPEDEYHRLSWRVRPWSNQVIPANTNIPLIDLDNENGFVAYLRISMDSPQPYIRMETEGESWRASIEQIGPFGWGQTQPSPFAWWNSMYNEDDGVYVMIWTPSPPFPYKRYFEVHIENETGVDVTVDDAEIVRWTTRKR